MELAQADGQSLIDATTAGGVEKAHRRRDLQALLNLVKSGVGSVSVVPKPTAWLSTAIGFVIYLGGHFLIGRCRRPRSYF